MLKPIALLAAFLLALSFGAIPSSAVAQATPEPTRDVEPLTGVLESEMAFYELVSRDRSARGLPITIIFAVYEFESPELADAAIQKDLENRERAFLQRNIEPPKIERTSSRPLGDAATVYTSRDRSNLVLAYVRFDQFLLVTTAIGGGDAVPLTSTLNLIEQHLEGLPSPFTIEDLLPGIEDLPEGYRSM